MFPGGCDSSSAFHFSRKNKTVHYYIGVPLFKSLIEEDIFILFLFFIEFFNGYIRFILIFACLFTRWGLNLMLFPHCQLMFTLPGSICFSQNAVQFFFFC